MKVYGLFESWHGDDWQLVSLYLEEQKAEEAEQEILEIADSEYLMTMIKILEVK